MSKLYIIIFLVASFNLNIAISQQDKDSVYTVVEKMPSFPGGNSEMMLYISKNLKYPSISENELIIKGYRELGIVSFTVTKSGEIKDVEMKRSTNVRQIDSIYIELIKTMPKWTPAQHYGKKVNARFSLPLRIKLQH